MPHSRSPEQALRRRERAIAKHFLKWVPTGSKWMLVPTSLASAAKVVVGSMAVHASHDVLAGCPHHHARLSTHAVRPSLTAEEFRTSQSLHRAANRAKHSVGVTALRKPGPSPGKVCWADLHDEDEWPSLPSRSSPDQPEVLDTTAKPNMMEEIDKCKAEVLDTLSPKLTSLQLNLVEELDKCKVEVMSTLSPKLSMIDDLLQRVVTLETRLVKASPFDFLDTIASKLTVVDELCAKVDSFETLSSSQPAKKTVHFDTTPTIHDYVPEQPTSEKKAKPISTATSSMSMPSRCMDCLMRNWCDDCGLCMSCGKCACGLMTDAGFDPWDELEPDDLQLLEQTGVYLRKGDSGASNLRKSDDESTVLDDLEGAPWQEDECKYGFFTLLATHPLLSRGMSFQEAAQILAFSPAWRAVREELRHEYYHEFTSRLAPEIPF